MTHQTLLILDFGSQYTQLIARRVRELSVYCEILPCTTSMDVIRAKKPVGLILSGGPAALTDPGAPSAPEGLWSFEGPILGVCYGMQLMARDLGGAVARADKREYGPAQVSYKRNSPLFMGLDPHFEDLPTDVWMSHGVQVERLPAGFEQLAWTPSCTFAAMQNVASKRFGLQFHPEVSHTKEGLTILKNFVYGVVGCTGDWTNESFIGEAVERIRAQVGDKGVILGLSGGVDSSVAAALLSRAIGRQLTCILVDNGLMRLNEADDVRAAFGRGFDLNLQVVDASERFLGGLKGETDPEKKRKIIGKTFIDVFEEEAKKLPGVAFLAQGTIYPDVIESLSFKGPSATIKSHHNVGGLPERMALSLVEPLRELFKDEVRRVGLALGLPAELINRHPFPGPGLGVRILGEVTKERADLLRKADYIFTSELRAQGLYERVSQAFAVLLPVKSVGVMGDERTHENVLALRSVNTTDFMTADWSRLPYEFLAQVSSRIINEVRGINRVTYDISSKPPATIEWE